MSETPNFTLRLPAEIRCGLEEEAARRGMSVSQVVISRLEIGSRFEALSHRLDSLEIAIQSGSEAPQQWPAGAGVALSQDLIRELVFSTNFLRAVAAAAVTNRNLAPFQLIEQAKAQAEARATAFLLAGEGVQK